MENSTLHHIWQYHYASDFAAGVRLLETHCPQAVTKRILLRLKMLAVEPGAFIAPYEQGKLENALHSHVLTDAAPTVERNVESQFPTPNPPIPQSPNPQSPIPNPQSPIPHSPLTSDAARALHKRHSHHHALLVSADTDEKRGEEAHTIMRDILPALDAEYDRLRAGDPQPGVMDTPPDGGEPVPNSIREAGVAQMKRLASLRTRIARLKNHLIPDAKTTKRKAELEKELAEKTAEKESLEKELA